MRRDCENQVAKPSTHVEEKEADDRIESPQYATPTVCKLDGYAIVVDDSTRFKMEQGQKNLQNQHETYFVDFVGVDQFDLFFDSLVYLINQLFKDYEKRIC